MPARSLLSSITLILFGCSSSEVGTTEPGKAASGAATSAEGPCPPGAELKDEQTAGGPRVRSCRRPDGSFHGLYQVTWPDGVVTAEGAYQDGREIGRWVFRHHSGRVWKEGEYQDGLLHGTWKVYDPEGAPLGTFEMDRGTGTEIRWWDRGERRQSIETQGGRPHGVTTWWRETGERIMEAHYQDGKASGTWTFWDPLGRTRKVEEWRDGVLASTTWFDPSAEEPSD